MNGRRNLSLILCFILAIFLISCTGQRKEEPKLRRYVSDPAPDTDEKVKILVYYDMEGISGLNMIKGLSYGNEEYKQAREWLTNDVNAVIDGLFAGGADVVHVVDAHGSGNPEPDILLDQMDSRAEMVFKDKPFDPYADLTEEGIYDAVVALGMHSRTGGGGFAAHTVNLGMDWILNDMPINETEIIAYSWGRVDVPVIIASGDDKLEEQLEWMDWLEFVRVKKAKGAGDAELIPFEEVHQEMREAAQRAVGNISNCKVAHLTQPIKAQLRAVHPASLDLLKGMPGIDYDDQIVTFMANDFLEAYDGVRPFMRLANQGYYKILYEIVQNQNNAGEIYNEVMEKLEQLWVEVESGRWEPPAPPEKKESGKKYFGAR